MHTARLVENVMVNFLNRKELESLPGGPDGLIQVVNPHTGMIEDWYMHFEPEKGFDLSDLNANGVSRIVSERLRRVLVGVWAQTHRHATTDLLLTENIGWNNLVQYHETVLESLGSSVEFVDPGNFTTDPNPEDVTTFKIMPGLWVKLVADTECNFDMTQYVTNTYGTKTPPPADLFGFLKHPKEDTHVMVKTVTMFDHLSLIQENRELIEKAINNFYSLEDVNWFIKFDDKPDSRYEDRVS